MSIIVAQGFELQTFFILHIALTRRRKPITFGFWPKFEFLRWAAAGAPIPAPRTISVSSNISLDFMIAILMWEMTRNKWATSKAAGSVWNSGENWAALEMPWRLHYNIGLLNEWCCLHLQVRANVYSLKSNLWKRIQSLPCSGCCLQCYCTLITSAEHQKIEVKHIWSQDNLAYLFTKSLLQSTFEKLVWGIGMVCITIDLLSFIVFGN